jgi:hypothetical protein
MVSALKSWIESFRSLPAREGDAQSAPPAEQPAHRGLDRALDDALDDVMARFAKALEHLAK